MITIQLNCIEGHSRKQVFLPIEVDWEAIPNFVICKGQVFHHNSTHYAPAFPVVEYLELIGRSVVDISDLVKD